MNRSCFQLGNRGTTEQERDKVWKENRKDIRCGKGNKNTPGVFVRQGQNQETLLHLTTGLRINMLHRVMVHMGSLESTEEAFKRCARQ